MDSKAGLLDHATDRFTRWQSLALSVLACAATTLIATPLLDYLDLANIVMLFLLTVFLVAVSLGRQAAILASVLSVVLFDIFFVPPRFSLAVNDIQYLVTFAVMLATGLITAHLAAGLRQQAREARYRAKRTQALYQVAHQLAGALTVAQVVEITHRFITAELKAQSAILLPNENEQQLVAAIQSTGMTVDSTFAKAALDHGKRAYNKELGNMGYAPLYLPLRASMRIRGVLAVQFENRSHEATDDLISLLEALSSLSAVALERLHYVEVAQSIEVKMLTERLRSSILSALSHDLRTPLTAMVGLADSLALTKPPLNAAALEIAQALQEQATRLANMVSNLLDMARLNAGKVELRREWQPLEEVVGASIKLLGTTLGQHQIKVDLPRDLPLLNFDAVLIERVLCNLLENASKYAPSNTDITLTARVHAQEVRISISDQGKGFPAENRENLFNMFVRGESETEHSGTGLGLAICKAIVESHNGRIVADNHSSGGACVYFTLPLGSPPIIEQETL
jgi:two-component system sensor histidine kinase KdpD